MERERDLEGDEGYLGPAIVLFVDPSRSASLEPPLGRLPVVTPRGRAVRS